MRVPSFEVASCWVTARPVASKNAGSCFSFSARALRRTLPSERLVGREEVGRPSGSSRPTRPASTADAATVAELRHARQRLARPRAVLAGGHVDAVLHVVELVQQDRVARRAVGLRASGAVGRLEERVEAGARPSGSPRSPWRAARRPDRSCPPTVQALRSSSSSRSRCTLALASSGLSILTSLPSRRRNSSFVKNVMPRSTKSRSKPLVSSWSAYDRTRPRASPSKTVSAVGERRAALPLLDDPRIAGGRQRAGAEVGADEERVAVDARRRRSWPRAG